MASFLERLRELQGDASDAEFARRCGIKYTTMKNYLTGRSLPPLDIAAQIADAYGKSIDWLFGRDPATIALLEDATVAGLKMTGEVIQRVYQEVGVRLPGSALVPEMTRYFGILLDRLDDPRDVQEWNSLKPWLENRIRRDLAEAAAAPGTGKREAS